MRLKIALIVLFLSCAGCARAAAIAPRSFSVRDALLTEVDFGAAFRARGTPMSPGQRPEWVRAVWESIDMNSLITQEIIRYVSEEQALQGFMNASEPTKRDPTPDWDTGVLNAGRFGFAFKVYSDGFLCEFHAQYSEYRLLLAISNRNDGPLTKRDCHRLIEIVDARLARLIKP